MHLGGFKWEGGKRKRVGERGGKRREGGRERDLSVRVRPRGDDVVERDSRVVSASKYLE